MATAPFTRDDLTRLVQPLRAAVPRIAAKWAPIFAAAKWRDRTGHEHRVDGRGTDREHVAPRSRSLMVRQQIANLPWAFRPCRFESGRFRQEGSPNGMALVPKTSTGASPWEFDSPPFRQIAWRNWKTPQLEGLGVAGSKPAAITTGVGATGRRGRLKIGFSGFESPTPDPCPRSPTGTRRWSQKPEVAGSTPAVDTSQHHSVTA